MKVTKKVASRRLKRHCSHCDNSLKKGDVYYLHRDVFSEDGKVYANEFLLCARCVYELEKQHQRFIAFQETKCVHPEEFRRTEYSYWEPLYDYCGLCERKFY